MSMQSSTMAGPSRPSNKNSKKKQSKPLKSKRVKRATELQKIEVLDREAMSFVSLLDAPVQMDVQWCRFMSSDTSSRLECICFSTDNRTNQTRFVYKMAFSRDEIYMTLRLEESIFRRYDGNPDPEYTGIVEGEGRTRRRSDRQRQDAGIPCASTRNPLSSEMGTK